LPDQIRIRRRGELEDASIENRVAFQPTERKAGRLSKGIEHLHGLGKTRAKADRDPLESGVARLWQGKQPVEHAMPAGLLQREGTIELLRTKQQRRWAGAQCAIEASSMT